MTAAAEQNDNYAIEQLACAYGGGNGVVRDGAAAMKWRCRGVTLNSSLSMWNIGFSMMLGDGVPRDVVEGYAWMSVGLKNLEPGVDPRQFRAELGYFSKTKMTPGQQAEGERRAQTWGPGDKFRYRG